MERQRFVSLRWRVMLPLFIIMILIIAPGNLSARDQRQSEIGITLDKYPDTKP